MNLDRIIQNASSAWNVPVADILGPSRQYHTCCARWSVMGALSDMGWTSLAIGKALNRDHSTVLYGLGRLSK